MSSTNHTDNYNLPQYVPTDVPQWLTDINQAFHDIDLAIHTVSLITDENDAQLAIQKVILDSIEKFLTLAKKFDSDEAAIKALTANKVEKSELATTEEVFDVNSLGFEIAGGAVLKSGNTVNANIYITAKDNVMNNKNNLFVGTMPVPPKKAIFVPIIDDESKQNFIGQIQPSGAVSFYSNNLPGVRHLLINASYCVN